MNRQQGMTLIGLLLTGISIIFIGLTLMRIVPVYLQYYSVKQSVKGLKDIPRDQFTDDPAQNVQILQNSLIKRLDVNGIDQKLLQTVNFKIRSDTAYDALIKYKVIRPLVGDISLLFDFTISEEIKIAVPT